MRALPLTLLAGVAALSATAGGLALFTASTARRIERALPPQGRFIDVHGNRLHYLDTGRPNEGSGPALVMVHGLGGTMRNFTYGVVDRLKSRFRVVVLERPGAGYSDRAAGASANLGVQADVVAAFIRTLGLERPLLVGHSLGGALVLAVALKHPNEVGGLALVSPLTQPQDAVPSAFRGLAISSKLLRRLAAWTLATPMAMLKRDAVISELFGPEAAPDDFALRGGGALGLRPRSFYSTSTDMMAINDDLPAFAARYPSLKTPAGVLFGASDRILDPKVHGEAMVAQLPGLTFETLNDAGHMIPVTQPQAVADFIERMSDRMARTDP